MIPTALLAFITFICGLVFGGMIVSKDMKDYLSSKAKGNLSSVLKIDGKFYTLTQIEEGNDNEF